jgi:hypothetical protein
MSASGEKYLSSRCLTIHLLNRTVGNARHDGVTAAKRRIARTDPVNAEVVPGTGVTPP